MKTPLKGLHLYFWRSASGEAIQLADIPTSRVYYTWRMIWNHLCPKNRRTPDLPFHKVLMDTCIQLASSEKEQT